MELLNSLSSSTPCTDGELRIISEGTFKFGYLEYCLNNKFGLVCGNNFDNKDAQVACRQLGYEAHGECNS